MTTDSALPARGRWIRATTLGWVLGFPLVIVLALAGEAIGIGGNQSLVGAAMGLGIGWMQGRALRTALGAPRRWIVATALGLALPFIIYDLSVALQRPLPYKLPYVVAIGGLCVGLWQSLILRQQFRGIGLWIVASLAGCTLAAGAAFIADVMQGSGLRGIAGALAFLGLAALGGPVLGVVTGLALPRLARRTRA
jgi:hypothetical protein